MVFSHLLFVMIAAIAVAIFAERRDIQPPLLLVVIGLAASYIPGLDRLELEPHIILSVLLPPLLYSAAREFSFESFRRRLGTISNLGVLLVLATTGIVGVTAAWAIPGLGLPAALVLAAVVSPPDAVTAVAVGRKLNLPAGVMTVLKGESLINDAAALTLFSFAAASITGTKLFTSQLLAYLAYSAFAAIVVGYALGLVVNRLRDRLGNPTLVTVLSVVVPFTAYLLAEEMGASGVLAVVAAGFALGHRSAALPYAARIQEREFWRTVDGLLETFVFAYIGLQLRFVIEDATEAGLTLPTLVGATLAVLGATILVRLAWVFGTAAVSRWRYRQLASKLEQLPQTHRLRQRPMHPPFGWRENLVIGWTGMRGVVTLAAAAGIPLLAAGGEAFPGRPVIQAVAFGVTIGTLLLQGLTLPWLIQRLGIADAQGAQHHAEQLAEADAVARQAAIETAEAYRDAQTDPDARRAADAMLWRLRAEPKSTDKPIDGERMMALARDITAARRSALIQARRDRRISDEVMREELERIDLEEAVMANWRPGGR
jgi:CPA1 family monovalent cation:H+ antiporter